MIFSTKPNRREIIWGSVYLAVNVLVLPVLLTALHMLLGSPLSDAQLNFVFFCINFLAVTAIFRKYLTESLRDSLEVPFAVLWCGFLGYAGNLALGQIVSSFCMSLYPGFSNVNDGSFALMVHEDPMLMFIGACLLVPVAEEVLYRGLIFRSLYDRSPLAAYLISMTLFAAVHVVGYVGSFQPLHLLLCFIQYLPAGYCLAFAYRRGGTIAAPIFMHILTNIAAVSAMR